LYKETMLLKPFHVFLSDLVGINPVKYGKKLVIR
jgi:hypothetical protein